MSVADYYLTVEVHAQRDMTREAASMWDSTACEMVAQHCCHILHNVRFNILQITHRHKYTV